LKGSGINKMEGQQSKAINRRGGKGKNDKGLREGSVWEG